MSNNVQPKVSVIVPIYNVEKYLRECLDSLVNQTLKEIEIICVNDGSTDSSLEIIREYAGKDERVVVIDKENSGYGASMNQGLQQASGEYIGIVESDDFAELCMFENLYHTAVEHGADVVKSNYWAYWSKPDKRNEYTEVLKNCVYNQLFVPGENRDIFYVRPCIWAAIYKRDFLLQNHILFTETPGASYQDTAFNFKVWVCAQSAYLIREAYLHYRRDNENSSVKSTQKVFCVCDEYAEIERYLQERSEKYEQFVCLKNRLKYETYRWNLERLSYELKLEFLVRMSKEFSEAQYRGELDRELFNYPQWNMLTAIINDPKQYFEENYSAEIIETAVSLENGCFMKTWNYMKQNGLLATFKKIWDTVRG